MATIIEIINSAYAVYMRSLDRKELSSAADELQKLLTDGKLLKMISAENVENARFLGIKIGLKSHAAAYLCEGYEKADFTALEDYVAESVQKCEELGFKKTGELCLAVLNGARLVNGVMADAVQLKARVCDFEGRCVAQNAGECRLVRDQAEEKIAAINRLNLPHKLFTDGAYFPDLKAQVIEDLRSLQSDCTKYAASFTQDRVKDVLRTGVKDITEELALKGLTYYPSEVNVEKLARAVVLCTPLEQEAEIFAWACAGGAKICRVQALALGELDSDGINAVFDTLSERGADCVIYGAPRLRGDGREFYRAAMRFGKSGRRVFIVADDGTRSVYEQALKVADDPLDISFLYLSLPDFTQTVEELQSLGMICDGEDIDFVRKNMPFMGFAGLNEAVKAYAAGGDWKKIACERSEDNSAAAQRYMLRLSRQALFIDGGWGNYHEDIVVNKAKSFDYDDIKSVNPDNIRKIMEGNFTLFQKCGMISTYCLLCGAPAQDWTGFSPELKAERLTEASKLVMRALGVGISPKVEVLEMLSDPNAGGLCCDGGKRIQYKSSSVKDFEWSARAVCHECFHAFQHHAINEGWQDWYETELHVTPGRVDQWAFNFGKYENIGKNRNAYLIQIVESDARAFESDCLGKSESRGQILNLLDLD